MIYYLCLIASSEMLNIKTYHKPSSRYANQTMLTCWTSQQLLLSYMVVSICKTVLTKEQHNYKLIGWNSRVNDPIIGEQAKIKMTLENRMSTRDTTICEQWNDTTNKYVLKSVDCQLTITHIKCICVNEFVKNHCWYAFKWSLIQTIRSNFWDH